MVLWEITVTTAYFLGLKRTYKLALKIQRRLVGPNHPKIRRFLHRRTRAAFDMALSVHRKIQQRDLEVGRNFGNWILRWLDRMKPSAEIRASLPTGRPPPHRNMPKHTSSLGQPPGTQSRSIRTLSGYSAGRLFTAPQLIHPKSAGTGDQYRNFHTLNRETTCTRGLGSVFRKDIAQWML